MHKQPDMKDAGVFLYSTLPNFDAAKRCAQALVEEKLAACANILSSIHSVYRWEDRVECSDEVALIVKTTKDSSAAAIARLQSLHPYDTPVIAEIPLSGGGAAFIDWLNASVSGKPG